MNHNVTQIDEEEINIIDYWRVIVKRKYLILSIVLLAIISSITLSLRQPNIYASTASILPPQKGERGGLKILSALSGGLGGLSGSFLGGGSATNIWLGILKSQTMKDLLIEKYDLRKIYKKTTIEKTRKRLNRRVKIEKTAENFILITVEDQDPKRAAEMARTFVEELDKINRSLLMTSGKRTRVFVQTRLNGVKLKLREAEEAIRSFQEKNGAVKLDSQSKAIIDAIGNVNAALMSKEVELQTLLSYATSTNPKVEILSAQIKELNERLRELEQGEITDDTIDPKRKGIFIPTEKIPELVLRYARLLRETKIQETLYELLVQQYEMARIQEAKDSPTIQVLDVPKPAEQKSKPKRGFVVVLSTFVAFFMAIFISFFLEYIKNIKKAAVETGGESFEASL